MLLKDSLIELNFSIRADDALRTLLILGRANGLIPGFTESLYNNLFVKLGFEKVLNKRELDNFVRTVVGTIDYNSIQNQVEDIFFKRGKLKLELDNKIIQIQEREVEIEQLKSEVEELQKKLGE